MYSGSLQCSQGQLLICSARGVARVSRWRGRPGLKSSLRKVCGLRCGFATRRMPSQQSRPIPPRVEHAGEGWRPFAGKGGGFAPLACSVFRIVYMPHSLVMQRTKEHEISEEFVELALGPPIFFGQTT